MGLSQCRVLFHKIKDPFLSLFHPASNSNNVIVQIHNVEMKLQMK